MSKALGVIPARWASTRFPGKMLAELAGKPLIQWVYERAIQSKLLDTVLVATDDERIRDAVAGFGGQAVMTATDHPSGTDRIAEAVSALDADIVVNIQGDEPLVSPTLLDRLVLALEGDAAWDVSTAAAPLLLDAERSAPSVVKVVFDAEHRALYFSRATIPHVREKESGGSGPEPLHWRHIGVYGYRRPFLEKLVRTPPSPLEMAEKLEQLRVLHVGGRIMVLLTDEAGVGVDTPNDLNEAERLIREAGLA